MPSIEGVTPEILWYTLIGIIGIGTLIVLGDKVVEVFRKKKERDKLKVTPTSEIANAVSEKVLKDLEPRFEEIDRKLAADKTIIDEHTRRLNGYHEGNKVLCRGILALLSHEINGNSIGKLEESKNEILNYLTDK